MNLLVDAELINPPTLLASFRELTFFATKYHPYYSVLVECDKPLIDLYYNYLKRYIGGLDFVKAFVYFGEEDGVLVSNNIEKLPNIIIDRITPENFSFLLQRIGFHL